MPSSFQASHHSSHGDTPSRHATPSYTPSVPLNEFGTPHTPSLLQHDIRVYGSLSI
ncbi:hypothetical protein Scep_018419 [Stephania cephalantha]|uniref:Uncharacterized protein n=1 Tax=Stephania cephalantha TaxID=152367 RepID=A0AAP0I922_9MAGN